MPGGIQYSVVVPVYRGAQTVGELCRRLQAFFTLHNYSYELIFVVDASPDDSEAVLKALQPHYPTLRLLELQYNAGQHAATLCGVLQAQGEYIITLDDDLQMPPEEIEKLIAAQAHTGADMVYGAFGRENHGGAKYYASRFIYKLLGAITPGFRYISTFRLFKRSAAANLTMYYQRYFLIDEVLKPYTPKVEYVKVQHKPRPTGRSGYSAFHLFAIMVNYLINYTYIPLRILLYGGLLMAVLGFALTVFSLTGSGAHTLLYALLACTGIVTMALGLVAEYHIRYLNARVGKPLFLLKQSLD